MMLYTMKKQLTAVAFSMLLGLTATAAMAAGDADTPLFNVDINVFDVASIQKGARTFTDYCLGCHSAGYMRFKRLARDLGYSEEEVEQYLLPPGRELGNTMDSAMSSELGTELFGIEPPDLSLVARSRGEQWLYSYFLSFYQDDERSLGWNNTVFPNASMPHVLWELQGTQVLAQQPAEHGEEHAAGDEQHDEHSGHPNPADQFELLEPGLQSPEEYRRTIQDLVTFLVYLSEPAQLQRHSLGIWVILFLVIFTFIAWLLKAEYWRDIH